MKHRGDSPLLADYLATFCFLHQHTENQNLSVFLRTMDELDPRFNHCILPPCLSMAIWTQMVNDTHWNSRSSSRTSSYVPPIIWNHRDLPSNLYQRDTVWSHHTTLQLRWSLLRSPMLQHHIFCEASFQLWSSIRVWLSTYHRKYRVPWSMCYHLQPWLWGLSYEAGMLIANQGSFGITPLA